MMLAKVIVFAVLAWMLDILAETDEIMKKISGVDVYNDSTYISWFCRFDNKLVS